MKKELKGHLWFLIVTVIWCHTIQIVVTVGVREIQDILMRCQVSPFFIFIFLFCFFMRFQNVKLKTKHFKYLNVWISCIKFSISDENIEIRRDCANDSFPQYHKMLQSQDIKLRTRVFLNCFVRC